MSELNAIATTLTSIKSAIDIGKILRDSNKSFEQAEFKIKISDMIDKLVDAKDHLQSSREENLLLREEILQLKQKLAINHGVEFDGSKYWIKTDGDKKEGPFCQKCKDGDGKVVRLLSDASSSGGNYWRCKVCASAFDVPPYIPEPPQRRSNIWDGF